MVSPPFIAITLVPTVTGAKDMGEVVVAVLNRPDDAEALLDAGAFLLDIGGGGRLKALVVRMPPIATIVPSEQVLTASREAEIRAEQEAWARQLRTVVDGWTARAQHPGIRTDWLDVEGDAAEVIDDQGRRADAIVIARPTNQDSQHMRACMHAALFESDRPVLVIPAGFQGPLGQVAAIAWKNDERAVKAVRASVPILRKARSVHVLCADDPADMPAVLEEHDIAAELHSVPDGEGTAAERILQAAHRIGADLLVMGAFAHGEWREMMFGGVTQTMLAEANLPLFMRH
ncbi:MAG TPA: universal stress protein [Candidatus Limnocylindria bacterium]|nr:universal stress protein [Candidatus Limnocylindria bacterium]